MDLSEFQEHLRSLRKLNQRSITVDVDFLLGLLDQAGVSTVITRIPDNLEVDAGGFVGKDHNNST
jgi:hypothetical protein